MKFRIACALCSVGLTLVPALAFEQGVAAAPLTQKEDQQLLANGLPLLLPPAKNSEAHLQANTLFNLRLIEQLWPYFREGGVIGGWRHDPYPDHPTGQALDVMVPDGGHSLAGLAIGHEVAGFLMANHEALGIDYLVWRQHIWKPGQTGWRLMEDRAHWTHNHMDHVHVKVFGDHTPSAADLILPHELGIKGMELPDGQALRARYTERLAIRKKVTEAQERLAKAEAAVVQASKVNKKSEAELLAARKTVDGVVRQSYMLGMDISLVARTVVLFDTNAMDPTALLGLEHQLNTHKDDLTSANSKLTAAKDRVKNGDTELKAAREALVAALAEQKAYEEKHGS